MVRVHPACERKSCNREIRRRQLLRADEFRFILHELITELADYGLQCVSPLAHGGFIVFVLHGWNTEIVPIVVD